VILGAGCEYDAAALEAIALMPLLETVQFGNCRKPTADEVAVLSESLTLRTIAFEHRGEPVYFDELATPASRQIPMSLTGKVVYDAEDAVRERPQNLILANFDEKLWPAILAAPEAITNIRPRDDWHNHGRLRQQLEVRQRERDKASEANEAATQTRR
jgi:hypothetical protein